MSMFFFAWVGAQITYSTPMLTHDDVCIARVVGGRYMGACVTSAWVDA